VAAHAEGQSRTKVPFCQIVGGLVYRESWYSSGFFWEWVSREPLPSSPSRRPPPPRSAPGRREGEGGRGGPFCRAGAEVQSVPTACRNQSVEVRACVAWLPAGWPRSSGFPAGLVFQQPSRRSPVNWPQLCVAAHAAGRGSRSQLWKNLSTSNASSRRSIQ
jgi:hypothetical protein